MTRLFFNSPRGHFSRSNGHSCFGEKIALFAAITNKIPSNALAGDDGRLDLGVCVGDGGPIRCDKDSNPVGGLVGGEYVGALNRRMGRLWIIERDRWRVSDEIQELLICHCFKVEENGL